MKKGLLVLGVLLVVAGIALNLMDSEPPERTAVADPETRRTTQYGDVVGYQSTSKTFAWVGIPYAAPPVGERRWRAPVPAEAWAEPLAAIQHGPVCPQFASALAGATGAEPGTLMGDEDCLTLDVYAPANAEGLPVMFWIHGGGNSIGTGSTYDGTALAEEQRVVVVSINYRLGVLGWLSHPAFRALADNPLDASGNFSNLDMVLALEWVRDNISAFGGNPQNVTIFGESAGGRNVFALLSSPLAKGLFHRAIAQSGLTGTNTLQRAENYHDDPEPGSGSSSRELTGKWLQSTGRAEDVGSARALQDSFSDQEWLTFVRSLSVEQLLEPLAVPGGMYRAPQHFRDGAVLPKDSLLKVFADPKRWNQVPLITGTNRDEAKLFLALDSNYVSNWLGFLPRVDDPESYNWMSAYMSDNWKALAVDEVAQTIAATDARVPVYGYRFDWDEGTQNALVDLPLLLGAAHAVELDFIWGPIMGEIVAGLYNDENAPGRAFLTQAMRGYWGQFARSGDPGSGSDNSLTPWQPWQANDGAFMVLDTEAGGGLRMSTDRVMVDDLKQRLKSDARLAQASARCAMYVRLFLDNGGVENFFDSREYEALECAEFPPWSLAERTN